MIVIEMQHSEYPLLHTNYNNLYIYGHFVICIIIALQVTCLVVSYVSAK